MDVVELLDSDEEQPVASEETPKKSDETEPTPTPVPVTQTSSTESNKSVVKNRPGPLSMKLKMGVHVEKEDLPTNKPESPATPDSDNFDSRKINKILTNLVDPTSKFLADFDPEQSIRERRKMVRKTTGPAPSTYVKPGTLYDEQGIHRDTGLDACDCLDVMCPGCHFACLSCGSHKW